MWLRVWENVTVIAFALRRLPVISQTRNFISGAADAVCRTGATLRAFRDVVNDAARPQRARKSTLRRTMSPCV